MSKHFNVCFANDTKEFIVKRYKTYTWARKYIEENRWLYANYRDCNQWAIERENQAEWGQTCVIAQSKNYSHKTRFRNRSEADKWVRGQGE